MSFPSNLEMKSGQGPPVIRINRQNDSKSLKITLSKPGRNDSPASPSRDRTQGNPIKRLSSIYKRFLDSQKMSIILEYSPIISSRNGGGICPNSGLDTWNRPSLGSGGQNGLHRWSHQKIWNSREEARLFYIIP